MNNTVILALIDALVSEAIAKIEIPSGPRGPRGLSGRDGNDFSLEDHKEVLQKFILENLPKNIELSEEQLNLIKGRDGLDGRDGKDGRDFIFEDHEDRIKELIEGSSLKFEDLTEEQITSLKGQDGRDGRDGSSFIFEEHEDEIREIIKAVSLKFEDLSEEQLNSLKGKDGLDGKDGRDGKDFSFKDSQDEINNLIISYLTAVKESLKLSFSDLTEEERDSLRGPRGQRGKVGKDFIFEEHESRLSDILDKLISQRREEFKLKFEQLLPEEKEQLKLKFSDLSDEERDSLRGPRGQRGKIGLPGKDGTNGLNGKDGRDGKDGKSIMGPPGISGKDGCDGRDGENGRDGEDAPKIVDVSVDQVGRDLTFNFDFEDGTTLKTNSVELPKSVNNYYSPVFGGGGSSPSPGENGGSGTDGKSAYQLALENGFVGTIQQWLESLKGENGEDGANGLNGIDGRDGLNGLNGKSAYEIALENGFQGTELSWLESLKGINGTNGSNGTNGIDGKDGKDGINGTNGSNGTNGVDGKDGKDGINGTNGVDGKDGINGTNGSNGTNGLNGSDGVDGKSAYQLAVENGFQGTEQEWLESLNATSDLKLVDEYDKSYSGIKEINFIGEYVKASPSTPLTDWPLLSEVYSLSDYVGPNGTTKVDVTFDIPDPSLIENIDCNSNVYVGSFIRMDSQGIAHNALADSYENSNVLGVVEKKKSLFKCDIKIFGKTSKIFQGLDTSLDYFLSDLIPGSITTIPPNSPGHVILKLGQAFSSEIFVMSKSERVIKS